MEELVGSGEYVMYVNYMAFRDVADNKWRVNRIDISHLNSLVLTLSAEFEYLWQVDEFVKKNT